MKKDCRVLVEDPGGAIEVTEPIPYWLACRVVQFQRAMGRKAKIVEHTKQRDAWTLDQFAAGGQKGEMVIRSVCRCPSCQALDERIKVARTVPAGSTPGEAALFGAPELCPIDSAPPAEASHPEPAIIPIRPRRSLLGRLWALVQSLLAPIPKEIQVQP